jgi:hypothetical protein
VAAQELGGGVDRDVDAVIEGAQQGRRGDGVVDDYRQASSVSDVGDLAVIRNVVLGIADRFEIDQARVFVRQAGDFLGVIRIEETHLDPQFLERLREQSPGASIKAGGGDQVLSRMRDGENGGRDGGLSGGERQPAHAPIERGQALLQHVVGGIHQARIDEAEFLQREKIGGVLRILEDITGSGVDGNGPRRGSGVWFLTGMQSQRAESGLAFRVWHESSLRE